RGDSDMRPRQDQRVGNQHGIEQRHLSAGGPPLGKRQLRRVRRSLKPVQEPRSWGHVGLLVEDPKRINPNTTVNRFRWPSKFCQLRELLDWNPVHFALEGWVETIAVGVCSTSKRFTL